VTKASRTLRVITLAACLTIALPAAAQAADLTRWGLDDINAPKAWTLSTGAGAEVAVVDTGVMASHPDLLGRVLPGGWGFDGTTEDSNGHGTAIAGLIAAHDDQSGITGVAPGASILPFRAFAGADAPSSTEIVEALDRAGASGARVVNASFSTPPYESATREMWNDIHAIENVLNAHPDTLYVTAAGNQGNDNDEYPVLPCSADVPNLICVGAYTQSGAPMDSSNYGAGSVDILAPGYPIYSTMAGGGYTWKFGETSMAAAFISGEAALLFAKVPQLTPKEAIGLILANTAPVPEFASKAATAGRPDAFAALSAATADRDGDGAYDLVDDCPGEANATSNGCAGGTPEPPVASPTPAPSVMPVPTPAATPVPIPHLSSLTTTVTRCKAGHKCRKSATVKLRPDRTANVSLRVERKICTGGSCRWTSVLTKVFSASTRGKTIVVRGKGSKSLTKGSYRVVTVLSSSAGSGRPSTHTFRVR
jgi:thermitase